MGTREKIEIPTISFTAVTLLGSTGNSSCNCDGYTTTDSCNRVLTQAALGCDSLNCDSDGASW